MNILLMTSTIAPRANTFLLHVSDPAERLQHYIQALQFYLGELEKGTFDRLVYVDNSGHPLDELHQIVRSAGLTDRVEFVSYASRIAPENSRYFLELNLLLHAMAQSSTIATDPDARIWKVTGRYIVRNIDTIVATAPRAFDLYLNLRNLPTRTLDFYLVCYRAGSFGRHIGHDVAAYQGTRNGEDILRERLDRGDFADTVVVPRLRTTPRLLGVRGFDGGRYGGIKDTAKYCFRTTLNAVLPRMWI